MLVPAWLGLSCCRNLVIMIIDWVKTAIFVFPHFLKNYRFLKVKRKVFEDSSLKGFFWQIIRIFGFFFAWPILDIYSHGLLMTILYTESLYYITRATKQRFSHKILDFGHWKRGWSKVCCPCSLVSCQIYHRSTSLPIKYGMLLCSLFPNLVSAGWLWELVGRRRSETIRKDEIF